MYVCVEELRLWRILDSHRAVAGIQANMRQRSNLMQGDFRFSLQLGRPHACRANGLPWMFQTSRSSHMVTNIGYLFNLMLHESRLREPSQYHGCCGNVRVALRGASLRFRMTLSSTSAISLCTLCCRISCTLSHRCSISLRRVSTIRASVLSSISVTSFLCAAKRSSNCCLRVERRESSNSCMILRVAGSEGSGVELSTR